MRELSIKQVLGLLPVFEEALSAHPKFSGFSVLSVSPMKNYKQDDYWGTSVKRYITDGENQFNLEGNIYVNVRDVDTLDMLLKVMGHEGAHLLEDEEGVGDEIIEYLEEVIKRLANQNG